MKCTSSGYTNVETLLCYGYLYPAYLNLIYHKNSVLYFVKLNVKTAEVLFICGSLRCKQSDRQTQADRLAALIETHYKAPLTCFMNKNQF